MINLSGTRKNFDFFTFSSNEYYFKNFYKAWQNWELIRQEENKMPRKGDKERKS